MAVLVEGITVIVRRTSIQRNLVGGWSAFVGSLPDATLCSDANIAGVGFVEPKDVESYVKRLERKGLTFLLDGKAADMAVVDQQRGPTTVCKWLEFGRGPFDQNHNKISICWFFDGSNNTSVKLFTPAGWAFENSLSRRIGLVATDEVRRFQFVRRDAIGDIEMALAADLPLLRVDPVLLEQALGQILGNAAKYSPPGSTIWVKAYRGVDRVVLSVQDQGAGLTADELGHLGERSFRGRRHAFTIAGSGLGMWIAQAFVGANGGTIDTSSEGEGRGTTVAFSFPIPDAGELPIPDVDDD